MNLQSFKDALGALKEALIIGVFIMLLLFPGCLNSILLNAGFTEASVMGFTWKQKALESKEVADSSQQLAELAVKQLAKMQANIDSISQKLKEASRETESAQVDSISTVVASSTNETDSANKILMSRVQLQKFRLNDIAKDIMQKK